MIAQSELIPDSSERINAPGERATFRERLFAYLIDSVILSVLTGCINLVGVQNWLMPQGSQYQLLLAALGGIVFLIIPAIYFIWPYSTSGQTPGKRAMKIKVVSIDGSPLTFGQGLVRTLGYLTSSIPVNLGYLWSLGDANKQTWHDKMAGTVVVPASVTREQFQGIITPAEARLKRRPWLLGLGIPTVILAVAGYMGFFLFVNKGVGEVRQMAPWPEVQRSPVEMISVDLSPLGLERQQVQDARDQEVWAGGNYEEGVLVTYKADTQVVVAIWALKYANSQTARNDYSSAQAYAKSSCGKSSYTTLGSSGIIHCQYSDAYNKVLWNDRWIVDIVAMEGSDIKPDLLVNQVRDAIAAHWSTMAMP